MKISGKMKVKTLKSQFKEEFGLTLRVYDGRSFADEETTLASIRKGDSNGGEFSPKKNMKVGNLEKQILKMYGIKVQVAGSSDNYLCNDDDTLSKAYEKDIKKFQRNLKRQETNITKGHSKKGGRMSGTVEAIAIESDHVNTFEKSENYKELQDNGLLFKSFYSSPDKHALYLIDLNSFFNVSTLPVPESAYFHLSVDKGDNFGFNGGWDEALEYFDIDVQGAMTFIVKGAPENIHDGMKSFYSTDISQETMEVLDAVFAKFGFQDGLEKLYEINDLHPEDLDDEMLDKIKYLDKLIEEAGDADEIIFDLPKLYAFHKLGLSCEEYDQNIVCCLDPDLKNYLKYMDILRDEIDDLHTGDGEGEFELAYSLWEDSYKSEVFEELSLDEGGEYISYPAIRVNDFIGEPMSGWGPA